MYALYRAAWIEVGRAEPAASAVRIEAIAEAKWALEQLESPKGREQFPDPFEPPHGVFYAGWTNWLRGGILSLYPDDERPAGEQRLFTENSARLADAFAKSDTPFLQSYPGQAWPVDSVIAVASLRLHDHLLPKRFEAERARWIAQAKTRLDPATGLFSHRADVLTGHPIDGPRGSSQSMLMRFLLEIDPEMGRDHYRHFRKQFVAPGWLLPGTREHPIGVDGPGDVDSGPLIDGVSLSASVASIAPARMVHDDEIAEPYFHLGEAMGLPVSWQGERRYLFGQLPIADAFLVYARTASAWTDQPAAIAAEPVVPWGWRIGWHVLTLGPCGFGVWLLRPRRLVRNS